ncbi:MAG TPA: peptidoglycan-binding domain-containing protein [Nitrospira sp.]|nr:peptidoglycan-binding domain-containing protein [Nitrospira sp.]
MSLLVNGSGTLATWIRKELDLGQTIKVGAHGQSVTRIQEWLNLHGFGLAIDSDFGPVTKRTVQAFQKQCGLSVTGSVNLKTFHALVDPLRQALAPIKAGRHTLGSLVWKYANAHLKQNPREIGGQNCGPWVRLYMEGHEGADWPWCAGFVSFVLKQAAETLQMQEPIQGSFSCDTLAAQAKNAGLFVKESDFACGVTSIDTLSKTCIFLVRRTETDWIHTGFATGFDETAFDTIEGNTNDEGSHEGYEVCPRARGYADKDFVLL